MLKNRIYYIRKRKDSWQVHVYIQVFSELGLELSYFDFPLVMNDYQSLFSVNLVNIR